MNIIRMENTSDGHNKFYEMWAGAYENTTTGVTDSAFVGIRYGKIGTQGQTNLTEFVGPDCKTKAWDLIQKKIKEKSAHGYEHAPDRRAADEPGTVGIDHEPGVDSNQLSMMEV